MRTRDSGSSAMRQPAPAPPRCRTPRSRPSVLVQQAEHDAGRKQGDAHAGVVDAVAARPRLRRDQVGHQRLLRPGDQRPVQAVHHEQHDDGRRGCRPSRIRRRRRRRSPSPRPAPAGGRSDPPAMPPWVPVTAFTALCSAHSTGSATAEKPSSCARSTRKASADPAIENTVTATRYPTNGRRDGRGSRSRPAVGGRRRLRFSGGGAVTAAVAAEAGCRGGSRTTSATTRQAASAGMADTRNTVGIAEPQQQQPRRRQRADRRRPRGPSPRAGRRRARDRRRGTTSAIRASRGLERMPLPKRSIRRTRQHAARAGHERQERPRQRRHRVARPPRTACAGACDPRRARRRSSAARPSPRPRPR